MKMFWSVCVRGASVMRRYVSVDVPGTKMLMNEDSLTDHYIVCVKMSDKKMIKEMFSEAKSRLIKSYKDTATLRAASKVNQLASIDNLISDSQLMMTMMSCAYSIEEVEQKLSALPPKVEDTASVSSTSTKAGVSPSTLGGIQMNITVPEGTIANKSAPVSKRRAVSIDAKENEATTLVSKATSSGSTTPYNAIRAATSTSSVEVLVDLVELKLRELLLVVLLRWEML